MVACKMHRQPDELRLCPTFRTLTAFWLLLAVPAVTLLLGVVIWKQSDASSAIETPAFALPLLAGLAVAMFACLVAATGKALLPLRFHRTLGLRHGRRWIAPGTMSLVRVEADDEMEHAYRVWLHLHSGERLELRRGMWLFESDHDRACEMGWTTAQFLKLPFVDACPTPTQRLSPEVVPSLQPLAVLISGHRAAGRA